MKEVYLVLISIVTIISCEKKNNEIIDPYALPWKTEYIHYENISMCISSHSYGYKLYYKDSLLKEECIDFGAIIISDSMLVNESILHLFFSGSDGSYVSTTRNGGYSWSDQSTGPPDLLKLHFVNTDLIYCVTQNFNDLYFSGIGLSDLSVYKDSLTSGTNYISDFGTNIIDIDSTVIVINDSVNYVILFK